MRTTADATEFALEVVKATQQVPSELFTTQFVIVGDHTDVAARRSLPVQSGRVAPRDIMGATADATEFALQVVKAAQQDPSELRKTQFVIAGDHTDVTGRRLLPAQSARATTPREEVIGEIRGWINLGKNWDGEGADVPIPSSLKDSEYFIDLLSVGYHFPEPMLLGNGRAGLYWNEGDLYADLEFLGDGRVTYFIEHKGQGKHKGVVHFRRGEMPPVFAALLRI
jgi:hypothetical protein